MTESSRIPVHRNISVFHSVQEIPAGFGPTVAAIGNFDGVHLGHQEILSSVVAEARMQGARAVAITFDPHPEQFLRPAEAPGLLTPVAERLRLLGFTGSCAFSGASARDGGFELRDQGARGSRRRNPRPLDARPAL